jgi:hypothetical protein
MKLYMVAPFLTSVSSDPHFVSFTFLGQMPLWAIRRKTTARLFYSAPKSPAFPMCKYVAYTLCCVFILLPRGLKAWIATHRPPLYQKSEASTRGFFCSLVYPLCSGLQKRAVL